MIMTKKPVTFTIDEAVLERFKKHCDDNDINMSKRVERYIKKEVGLK